LRKVLCIVGGIALVAMGTLAGGVPVTAHAGHQITVTDDAVNEGGTATVTVTVNPATQNTGGFTGRKETITVGVATIDGTAVAPDDYTSKAQTLTFAPGESTKSFTVATAQDALSEGNETFTVRLSNPTFVCIRTFGGTCPSSGAITDDTGVVTIVDDEAPPTPSPTPTPAPGSLLISDVAGATKATDCVHTVTLTPASASTVTVDFTATGDVNQLGNTSGSLSFSPGETSRAITLDVIKQKRKKGVVTVTLSNAVGANIVDGTGTCTIKKKRR
jgi:endoglucanase